MSETKRPGENPDLQELLKRGHREMRSGNIAAAAKCCQQALQQKPDLVPAHFLVGLVALEGKDRKTAFSAFRSVVELDRDHGAAWAQLAKLHMSEGQVNMADAALRETLRIKPGEPVVLDMIGTTLSLMGEYDAAKSFYEQANARKPDSPPLMQNLANNLVYHGDTDGAEAVFERIIAVQPNSPQSHWGLSSSRKATDTTHIDQMRSLLAQVEGDPRSQAFYLYAIGKEWEDLQQWEEAFAAFERGAAARRGTVEYDEAAEQAMFDYLEAEYTRGWLDGLPDGNPDPAPIFVLGQPRTGTTLVERVVSSHSQVHSAGELQQFGLAVRRLSNYRNPKRFSQELFELARRLEPAQLGGLYLQTTRKMRGSRPRFVDKLPQNYLYIPLILKALPNAKIVHLVREPMDACFASFKQLFADAYLHSYDQREMARHHVRYRRLMDTWRERFPGRFFDISYEATARDLEPNARALIDYLDLPWEEACLRFHQQEGAVSTASAVQVREPAHTRSIGRWRRYREHLQPMMEELQQAGLTVK
jgi:tetratricopeptide (TPR) repeat protein